jgi:hypothetical protein
MLIPCDAPLAEVAPAYLEAGDFTPSSRATYRRVLGELACDLDSQRPADGIAADELAAWFLRTPRHPRSGHLEPGPGHRPLVRPSAPRPGASGPADAAASQRVPCDRRTPLLRRRSASDLTEPAGTSLTLHDLASH